MLELFDFAYIWSYRIAMLLLLVTTIYYYKKSNKVIMLLISFSLYNLAIYSEYIAYLLNEDKSIQLFTYSFIATFSKLATIISHVFLYLGIIKLIRENRNLS
jgi:hypothetical protein